MRMESGDIRILRSKQEKQAAGVGHQASGLGWQLPVLIFDFGFGSRLSVLGSWLLILGIGPDREGTSSACDD